MKKIFVIAVLSFLLISCGKKADPEYKGSLKINSLVQTS
tara:strand:- start:524 stop:640 length:117 start_codon:yes stop_codon:yes gene_type:complete